MTQFFGIQDHGGMKKQTNWTIQKLFPSHPMRVINKLKDPIQVKPPKIQKAAPCALEVANMFNCWRTSGVTDPACMKFAQQVSMCMKGFKPSNTRKGDDINSWLKKVYKNKQL
jgi:hypothetical protein